MVHRGFFALAIAVLGAFGTPTAGRAAQASASIDHTEIREAVIDHLRAYYTQTFGALTAPDDLDIAPGNLDPRLALSACAEPLAMQITSPDPMAANVTVKVNCQAPKPWTIYVPVKIDRYVDVYVAARSLARGTLLSSADLRVARMSLNQAGSGYLQNREQVLGMELVRSIALGASIQANALRPPRVVTRGERVELSTASGGIAVATRAEALSHGRLGERIRVKNLSSQRVIEATVTGPGAVSVGRASY